MEITPPLRGAKRLVARVFGRYTVNGTVIALHQRRCLFVLVPKAACTSLSAVCADCLHDELDADFLSAYWNDSWKPAIFRNPESEKILKEKGIVLEHANLRDYPQYRRFAFVRHPLDRLVSCWNEKIAKEPVTDKHFVKGVARGLESFGFASGMPFEAFAKIVCSVSDAKADPHFCSQHRFLCDSSGRIEVNLVGHMETIADDFRTIAETCDLPVREFPHLLRKEHDHFRTYYNDKTYALVSRRYREDMRYFGYK